MNFIEFKIHLFQLAENINVTSEEIQALIFTFFKNKSLPHLESRNRFVVRCNINEPGEVFPNISRCSYPPKKVNGKIKIQRANYPGQQVFYCTMPTDTKFASASSTAIVETAWEHIEDIKINRAYATLSRWDTSRPLSLWVLPFSDANCKKNDDIRNIRDDIKKLIINNKTDSVADVDVLEFFSNAFCERENKATYYRITSAYYNMLLDYERDYKLERDGLMYPSANTEAAGINIVLKKELVDDHTLTCSHVQMNSVTSKQQCRDFGN